MLGGLAADQRAAGSRQPSATPPTISAISLRHDLAGGDVVDEEQRSAPQTTRSSTTIADEVQPDGVVLVHRLRER